MMAGSSVRGGAEDLFLPAATRNHAATFMSAATIFVPCARIAAGNGYGANFGIGTTAVAASRMMTAVFAVIVRAKQKTKEEFRARNSSF